MYVKSQIQYKSAGNKYLGNRITDTESELGIAKEVGDREGRTLCLRCSFCLLLVSYDAVFLLIHHSLRKDYIMLPWKTGLLLEKMLRRKLLPFLAVMVGLLKKTTGLVGLAVCETPHERLKILYTKILDVLGHIPKNAAYRKYTEQITNEKLSMVKAEPDVKKLEE